MTQEQKQKLHEWLTGQCHQTTMISDLIIQHVERYFPPASPAATVRGAEEITEELWDKHSQFVDDDIDSLSMFASTCVITKSGFNAVIKDFQFEYVSQFGYTLAQVSDAWDACKKRLLYEEVTDGHPDKEKYYAPDKQTFLNSLKTPEIK